MKNKIITLIIAVIFVGSLIVLNLNLVKPNHILTVSGFEYSNLSSNFLGTKNNLDNRVYSTATLDDDFCDTRIIVVLTRHASRDLNYITIRDFSEIDLYSVRDISPALELAKNQIQINQNREKYASGIRGFAEYKLNYNVEWSVDLENFRRIIVLTLRHSGRQNVLNAIRMLEKRSDIISAEPNFYKTLDPTLSYTNETNLIEPLTGISTPWGINQINAPDVWGQINNPSLVRIGVMDTGIYANHPAFSGSLDKDLFRNFTNDGHNVFGDQRGHGTHVAGTIAGARTGVAHENVRLVSLRVMDTYTGIGNIFDQVSAIEFATNLPENQRIHILNASLGGITNHNGRLEAIRQFPGLFVASAGNNNRNNDTNPTFPANHRLPNLISVGASRNNDLRSTFSNWGRSTVCVFAPGGEGTMISSSILSAFPASRCDGTIHHASGFKNCEDPVFSGGRWHRSHVHYAPGYHLMNGTSMAAPHVAGVAALMLSYRPDLSPAEIREAIIDSVDVSPAFENISVSGGRVNAYAAVRRVSEGRWVQPRFTSASNEQHGTINASGSTNARPGWGAFDGWVGDVGPGNASGFGAAQWTKNARSGWVELRLNYMIEVQSIVFLNRFSSGSHRTRNAYFTGSGGVSLGEMFVGVNQNAGRSVIQVGGVRTSIVRLNITSSWGSYIGANEIIINATEIDPNEQAIKITNFQELDNIRNTPNGNFILTNDITAPRSFIPRQWRPIPTFHGTLNGNGHTVSGINITRNGTSIGNHLALGMFANLYGTVRNLSIVNSHIYVGSNHNGSGWIVAGLVTGFLRQGGIIENVNLVNTDHSRRNSVEVNRDRSTIGMIAGESHGIIRNSVVSNFDIGGNGDIGGVVGTIYGGSIYNNRVFGGDDNLAITWYWRSSTNRSIGGIVGFAYAGIVHSNRVENLLFDMLNTRNYGQLGTIVGRSMIGGTANFFNNMSIGVYARDGLGTWFLEDQRGRVG